MWTLNWARCVMLVPAGNQLQGNYLKIAFLCTGNSQINQLNWKRSTWNAGWWVITLDLRGEDLILFMLEAWSRLQKPLSPRRGNNLEVCSLWGRLSASAKWGWSLKIPCEPACQSASCLTHSLQRAKMCSELITASPDLSECCSEQDAGWNLGLCAAYGNADTRLLLMHFSWLSLTSL